MEEERKTIKTEQLVNKPIEQSFLIIMTVLFVVLCTVVVVSSYFFFSDRMHNQYSERLQSAVKYVDNHIDADDMKQCIESGVTSEKYALAQAMLNEAVDAFGLKYLYVVIPEETVMVNVVSATSQAERDAGEEDMPLLDESDEYSPEELKKFKAYMDADGIGLFEETSGWGEFYTGCLSLRTSDGEAIALICADISMDELRNTVTLMMLFSVLSIAFVLALFGVFITLFLHNTVANPLAALEKSTRSFAKASHGVKDIKQLKYEAPEIKTENEVKALAVAIESMAEDLRKNISETVDAEKRAATAEEKSARLAEEAENAAKIARLSGSIGTLLDNMPTMTFYKDIEEGKYLACNQSFAEHAGKSSPSEIIGLTDFDLYDEETAKHFIEADRIALSMDKPYVFFEEGIMPNGKRRQFQTTKLKFTDADGVVRILGMCTDVTEIADMRRESELAKEAYEEAKSASVTYAGIARALSLDYIYIYYVNIKTDEFIEYHSDAARDNLVFERRGGDFFGASRRDARKLLHKDDQDVFISAFTKENILEKIDMFGMFTVTYRLMIDGAPTYVNMKITRITGDEDHIIIGVNNVDVQIKDQEALERINEERITYARITALSGDYIGVYTVDPVTDEYSEYGATAEYETLGIAKSGKHFFDKAREDAVRLLYIEDVDMFLSVVTKENVLKEIEQNGVFVLEYRLMINGAPTYVALKAAKIEEKDGPQIIIGVSNIDAQVKREQEYAHKLSDARLQADIDALTGVRNKHAYIDVEAQLNRRMEENEPVSFAIVVFDINKLKEINDLKGHLAGDEHIRGACRIICDVFKHSPVFRVGGDEFTVIAQGKDYDNIDALMAEIAAINAKNAAEGGITIAYGMAKYEGDRSVSAVFERADVLMYANKRDGRD